MKRKPNFKFLGAVLLAGIVGTAVVYALHAYQIKRNAGAYRFQAERAQQEGDLDQAIHYYKEYLGFMPGDTDAFASYALLLADERIAVHARAQRRAYEMLEQVLRRDDARDDVRRALTPLALQLGMHAEARPHVERLLQSAPDDPRVLYHLGRCQEADGDYPQAADTYRRAIERRGAAQAPFVVESYQRRAALLRTQLKQPAEADKLLAEMTQAAPDSAEAILFAAGRAAEQQDYATARQHLQRGIERHPSQARLYLALAQVERQAQQPPAEAAALRQGVKALPDSQAEQLFTLADLLADAGQAADVRAVVERLEKAGAPENGRLYLQARLDMSANQWREASQKLERARALLARAPDIVKKADVLLARCYEAQDNPDLQLTVSRRAVGLDPSWLPARASLATALLATGRFDEALDEHRKLAAQEASFRLPLARLLIVQTLRRPAAERRWAEVEAALDELARTEPDAADLPLLRAEVKTAQGQTDEARKLLEAARDRRPQQAALWLALANLSLQAKQPEQAQALLTEAVKQAGDRVEFRLAQARLLAGQATPAVEQALAELEKNSERFAAEERRQLFEGLAESAARAGAAERARQLWEKLAAEYPNDLASRLALFELAARQGQSRAADAKRLLDEVRRIEGDSGVRWRLAAVQWEIAQAAQGDRAAHAAEASRLLDEAAARRPSLPQLHGLRAQVFELQGDLEHALESYQEAVRRGDRRADVIRRAAQLLHQQKRYPEAASVIRQLPEGTPLTPELGRLSADLALRTDDRKSAAETAEQVAAKSTDFRDHVWRGQVHWAAGRPADAEAAFRRACELAEQQPEPWLVLIVFLAGTEQKTRAEEIIGKLREKTKAEQRSLALALAYEAIDQPAQAQKEYDQALKDRPADVEVLRSAAGFHMRQNRAVQAADLLQRLLKPDVQASEAIRTWARRSLAMTLAAQGGKARVDEALQLLDKQPSAAASATPDQRARAVILAAHPRRRLEAVGVLEDLRKRNALLPDDQFLLARLYEVQREDRRARELLVGLLAAQPDHPRYLAHHVRSLLAADEAPQAEIWLQRLEKVRPQEVGTLELKVRLLQARGKKADAAAVALAYAETKNADTVLAASWLEDLGRFNEAEGLYRKAIELSQRPETTLALAGFLARQKRLEEMLQICDRAWQSCPPELVAFTCVASLRAATPKPEQVRQVEQWLAAALRKKPESIALWLAQSDLLEFQGQFDKAEKVHRQVLQRDPANVVSLNNLAWLLAFQNGKTDEALQLINRGIDEIGLVPHLLDTRGVILLRQGQTATALKDLQEAVAQAPTPTRHWHLAQAHWQAKDRAAARKEIDLARRGGLDPDSLHPLEKAGFERFIREVEQ
ncbi:MAG: tetratricopeptide repeat protein [Planctomycetia bacterium]|nr:tetratricopeptide repeat protein [Planctomycetia bacterium]